MCNNRVMVTIIIIRLWTSCCRYFHMILDDLLALVYLMYRQSCKSKRSTEMQQDVLLPVMENLTPSYAVWHLVQPDLIVPCCTGPHLAMEKGMGPSS